MAKQELSKEAKEDEAAVKAGRPSENQKLRWAKVFRSYDTDNSGSISSTELQKALEVSGFHLPPREFQKFLTEVDLNGDNEICFEEFCEMAFKLSKTNVEYKSKNIRIPRQYLAPEQYDQYVTLFHQVAGDDGCVDIDELFQFFVAHKIHVTRDRLQVIMSEVDTDNSGYLDEVEFMVLLIKAMAIKKRKVGPGLCPIQHLRDEGWTLQELRRIGYDCAACLELGAEANELLQMFSVPELGKAGLPLSDLLAAGWDGSQGREAGYTLDALVEAGCSVRKIRTAGYDDFLAAVSLRKLGMAAKQMKFGGWPLSELKLSGFSTTDLRLAGYSTAALSSLQQQIVKAKGRLNDRRNTFTIREEAEKQTQASM